MPGAELPDLVVVARGREHEAILPHLVVLQVDAILQHRGRHLVGRVAAAQTILTGDGLRRVQPAFAFEQRLVGLPRIRCLFVEQHGAVLEVALSEIVLDLLVRRDAVADDAAQVGAMAAGLVHP